MSFYDDRKKDDKLGKVVDPVVRAVKWVQTRSAKEKGIMLGAAAVTVIPDLLLGVSHVAGCLPPVQFCVLDTNKAPVIAEDGDTEAAAPCALARVARASSQFDLCKCIAL